MTFKNVFTNNLLKYVHNINNSLSIDLNLIIIFVRMGQQQQKILVPCLS